VVNNKGVLQFALDDMRTSAAISPEYLNDTDDTTYKAYCPREHKIQ